MHVWSSPNTLSLPGGGSLRCNHYSFPRAAFFAMKFATSFCSLYTWQTRISQFLFFLLRHSSMMLFNIPLGKTLPSIYLNKSWESVRTSTFLFPMSHVPCPLHSFEDSPPVRDCYIVRLDIANESSSPITLIIPHYTCTTCSFFLLVHASIDIGSHPITIWFFPS